jgi:hypothetical protein
MRLLGILSLLLVWVSPAAAATVGVTDATDFEPHGGDFNVRTVHFTAAPGEANRLEIAPYSGHGLRLHDPAGLSASAPCVSEDAQTAFCPQREEMLLKVALGDGDDTLTAGLNPAPLPMALDAGDGNDVVDVPVDALQTVIDGGLGDDTLTGHQVRGGPGADVLRATVLDYTDHTAAVTVDLAAGVIGAAGENDRVLPGATEVRTGPGPDVIRAGGGVANIAAGAGDDVIDGTAARETIDGGDGNDVIRAFGGNDYLSGSSGDDRIEAGDGRDYLSGGDGDDVLDGGAGRDQFEGARGTDRLLARDGERDEVACAFTTGAGDDGLLGDRATIDTRDEDSWCGHVTGARRLVFHGLTRTGSRSARIVVSCHLRRACSARLRVHGGRAARRVRVPAGRRARIPVRLSETRGEVSVDLVTPSGVLSATLE